MDNLLENLVKNLLPEAIYQHFAAVSLTEKQHGIEMRLEEYPELLPAEMTDKTSAVLDGFCNPLELLHFSIKGKPLYLKLYRRRWKESGSNSHYSNRYDLHPEGVKATHEFASFLKEKLDALQMNTSAFSSVLNLDAQLVWRWYRDHLSGFKESEANGEHYCHDLHFSGEETVRVPVFKAENFGKSMAIDEKQIGEEMHTIVSNRATGKIALLVRSMQYENLQKILNRESIICRNVETLTRDLSPLYAKVGSELFFNSSPVADKFHIIRSLLEACQDVRVRLRQDLLRERRLKQAAHKKQEKDRKQACQACGEEYVSEPFKYEEEKLSNEETELEYLARSRYLLFKYPDDWTLSQRSRTCALFEKFPEIEKVYRRCCEFRDWMKKENVGRSIRLLKKELQT